MYVPTLPRRAFGALDTPNPTPWVAGALLLLLAVFVPKMTKKLGKR